MKRSTLGNGLALAVAAALAFVLASPAMAFDGRGGERVVIASGEIVHDDLYVGADEFVLEGTVAGDLIVGGTTITINGTVQGDLWAAGQTVIINGTITDDARIAGAALQLGDEASIGGDLLAAGASLETREGSDVAGELLVGSGQASLGGEVTGDVLAGTGGLELRGTFGGDVDAFLGDPDESGPPMNMYMTNIPVSIPAVRQGLTVDGGARIVGNLQYTSAAESTVPSGVVAGEIIRHQTQDVAIPRQPTRAERAAGWSLNLARSMATLLIFGLMFAWLAPSLSGALAGEARSKPAASLGWGVVAYAAFVAALVVTVLGMIIGGTVFALLKFGGVTGAIIWSGLAILFAAIVAFVLVTVFVAKIVVGTALGNWILGLFNSNLVGHRIWPMVIGVVIIALLVAVPAVGWLFALLAAFIGLGAIWLWAAAKRRTQSA